MAKAKTKTQVAAKPKTARVDPVAQENAELRARVAELEAKVERLRDRP